jgi:cell wall-associated NlpC family hydrolase
MLCGLAMLTAVAPTAASARRAGGLSGGTSAVSAATRASAAPPASTAPTSTASSPSGALPSPAAGAPQVSGGSAPVVGAKPGVRMAPVTARTASLLYKGPVYEKTLAGTVVPYAPPPPVGQTNGATGGSPVSLTGVRPELLVPGVTARYVDGLAAAPMSVPPAVQEIVWAANQIIGLPYVYGGGHASFASPGYDCSGTVSFALHGASLLGTPMDSSELMGWGGHGLGQWVTVFSNPEHAYMTVAGLRLDTSAADDPTNQQGPRWRPLRPENRGYVKRHPAGL